MSCSWAALGSWGLPRMDLAGAGWLWESLAQALPRSLGELTRWRLTPEATARQPGRPPASKAGKQNPPLGREWPDSGKAGSISISEKPNLPGIFLERE